MLANVVEGGIRAIGDEAKVNWQTLDQVLKGTLLPPRADGSRSPRRLGHEAAMKIEDALELGRGWFDSNSAIPSHLNPGNIALKKLGAGTPIVPGEKVSLASLRGAELVEQDTTIEQFDTGGAMGSGLVLHDQPGVIRKWVVSPEWVQQNVHRITSPKNLAIVTGFGDSMRPLYNPGDPLLIDRGIDRADIDGIYFFRVGDEGFVKRLQRIPTLQGVIIRAKSENLRYDPFDIVDGMDFQVFGRVVKAWRGEDF
ncbi:transcriptional regulator [Variovorax sp. PMC12]|nr:transcriptional regulator [Variovorax sp. PMC12]